MDIEHKVDVSITFDSLIEMKTHKKIDGIWIQISHEVLQLKEKAIRDALIKLGWTPPKEDKR